MTDRWQKSKETDQKLSLDVASGNDLPKRVDKFYPNRPFQNDKVLPIADNQRVK